MISSNKKYIASGIAVKLGGLVLLGRRSSVCENLAGYWSIPCGMIEKKKLPSLQLKENFLKKQDFRKKKYFIYWRF